jgi:hypothetical protein
MKVPLAFVADEANLSQEGKLNVLGMFDRVQAMEFPVVHPKMVFAFRVEAEPGDAERPFSVAVRLVDGVGEVLFEAAGEMVVPRLPPGETFSANQVFSLVGIQFPRADTYRFVVQIAGETASETALIVSGPAAPVTGLN